LRKVRLKLKEVLKERNLTQTELADLTKEYGSPIRQASISDMVRNSRDSVNMRYIETIAHVLEIDDITELIDFVEK
jgi:putative transcriptional regulator